MTQAPPIQPRTFQLPSDGEEFEVAGHHFWMGKELGRGWFGAVYECTDEWGNQLAAKVLFPRNRPYEEIRGHFLHEVEKLQALRHPNITYIHTAFEARDTFFVVIERCSFTLATIINNPNLEPDLWIPWVARDILHGLDYIHANGHVHKDIHPGNVHVSLTQDRMLPDKEPVWSFKIADLGITALEKELEPNTMWAQWMRPPEVIDTNQFGAVSRGVDLYHVGLLLLALTLKKQPPFTPEEIVAAAPRQLAEASKSKYAQEIAVALRRHPGSRYQSALEFWRAISARTRT